MAFFIKAMVQEVPCLEEYLGCYNWYSSTIFWKTIVFTDKDIFIKFDHIIFDYIVYTAVTPAFKIHCV